jgi:hypothetical protein
MTTPFTRTLLGGLTLFALLAPAAPAERLTDRSAGKESGLVFAPPRSGSYPGTWKGSFIWDQKDTLPYNHHLMFRKTFTVKSPPLSARIHITVSDKYRLFINGHYVGRGPARNAGPFWTSYDTHDITAWVAEGSNTIAVHGYYYGCPTVWSSDMPPGLWAEVEVLNADGSRETIVSDATWRVHKLAGYVEEVQRINGWLGPIEVYRAPPQGDSESDYVQPSFADDSWSKAVVIAKPEAVGWGGVTPFSRPMPWLYLEPRDVPPLVEREVLPARIVRRAEAWAADQPAADELDVWKQMTQEQLSELGQVTMEKTESLLTAGGDPVVVRTKDNRSAVLILDFGRPVFGFPHLDVEAPPDAVLDITYGNALVNGRVEIDKASKFGDRRICRAGRQVWQTFDGRQFRYLQLVIRKADREPVKLHKVAVVSHEYPVHRRDRFECSDKTLTDLWKAGENTIFLHLEDTLVCDATRERAQYPIMTTLETAVYALYPIYGDAAMASKMYRATARMQLADGHFPVMSGSGGTTATGLPKSRVPYGRISLSGYPNASFGYVFGLYTHYLETGDVELVERLYPSVLKLAGFFEMHADHRGLLENLPQVNWMDWTGHELRGINFWNNASWARMLELVVELGKVVGMDYRREHWLTLSRNIKQFLRDNHWNEQQGLFTDSVMDARQSPVYSELSNAGALLFGVADQQQTGAIVKNLRERRPHVVKASPLTFYYLTESLIAAGASDFAWEYLSSRFAPVMGGSDFPTIPEGWAEQKNTGASKSHIHSSGCGLVMSLSRHALGVYPAKPGFEECRIAPQPGHLTWVRGVYPSPKGDIKVDWQRSGGDFTLKVDLPANLKTVLVVPAEFTGPDYTCVLDGKAVNARAGIDLTSVSHAVRCTPKNKPAND